MQILTSQQLREKINSGENFIVDMYADWCGPCRVLGPIFEKFAKELETNGSSVGAYKFNIESDKELAAELGVRSIPTIKAFSSGNVVSTKVGVLQESQLKELVSEVF